MSLHVDKKQEVDLDEECEPDNYDPEDTYMQDIASDMALEIGLRERLLETVKSRIAWALLLKESLTNETSAVLQTLPQTLSFKEAALDALAAIEAPSEILFVRDEPIPPSDTRRQSVTAKLRKKPTARAQPAMKGGKFLYIRLEGSNAPSILRCPNCLRTEFSSLQGLFNHARGTHSLAWTSHDECVRQCACALEDVQGGAVDFADLDAGVEVGAGTGGVLPGLRRLFERAVDEDDAFDLDGETALSRTLGFHVDTPALASFLGRKPIRRGVTVWDPDAVVDIDGFGADEKPRAKPRWRMPFTHRNVFTELPPQVSTPLPPVSSASPPPPATKSHTLPTSSSRFHVVTRIVVVDRSLWLPPDQRLGADTHKWMISVHAPSYAHHITTVLQSLTVKSPTSTPLLTTAPPFVVIGTADTPFLARVELAFSGTSVGGAQQKVMLEHWVELDRMQSPSVVLGEEQIVDVELDRGTLFFPLRSGYMPVGTRALWDMALETQRHTPVENAAAVAGPVAGNAKDERKTRNALPKVKILGGWQDVLKKLIERFPLTLQDVKGGKPPSPALPYKLAANPSQFSALVMGRKKAIEWGRAMAMRDAYSDAVLTGLTEDVTMLTTADIFSWLHTNGHFPRGLATLKKEKDLQILNTGFCHVCGLAYRLHSVINDPIGGAVKSELRNSIEFNGVGDSFVCHITPTEWQLKRMPMIDISRLLPWRPRNLAPSTTLIVPLNAPEHKRSEATRGATWESRARGLLALSDPKLIQAVRPLVSALKLPAFHSPRPPSPLGLPTFPIDPAFSRAEVEVDVAPYAMISVLTKLFVRALVRTGLEVAARDRQRALMHVDGRARRLPSIADMFSHWEPRMLTPGHILRGVVARGWDWTDELGMALLGCLSRSGVPLHRRPSIRPAQTRAGNLTSQVSPSGEQETHVKTEPQGAIIHRMDSAIP